MKGIIFNLAEETITAEHGADVWDDLLSAAGLDGSYTCLGSYPDADLERLIGTMAAALNEDPDVLIRWFGERAMPLLARRYPGFFAGHGSTRTFLLTLNDIIHAEVRKLYVGADVPVFEFDTSAEDALVMRYRSGRRLCSLAEGFIGGAATLFGERASIVQTKCMKQGGDACDLHCRFSPADG